MCRSAMLKIFTQYISRLFTAAAVTITRIYRVISGHSYVSQRWRAPWGVDQMSGLGALLALSTLYDQQ